MSTTHTTSALTSAITIRYGATMDGQAQQWQPEDGDAHCVVVGSTGSGANALLRRMAATAAAQGMTVHACDPLSVELLDVPGVVRHARTPDEIQTLVGDIHALMLQRYSDLENGLPDQSPPVLLVVSDFLDLRGQLQRAHEGAEDTLRLLADLARLGRTARVHLLIGMNRPDPKVLTGEFRDNLRHRITVGPLSPTTAQLMWEDPRINTASDALGQAIATTPSGTPAPVLLDEPRTEENLRGNSGAPELILGIAATLPKPVYLDLADYPELETSDVDVTAEKGSGWRNPQAGGDNAP